MATFIFRSKKSIAEKCFHIIFDNGLQFFLKCYITALVFFYLTVYIKKFYIRHFCALLSLFSLIIRCSPFGGVPNAEITALNGLLHKCEISVGDIFAEREEGYSNFRDVVASKAKIRTVFEDYWRGVEAEIDEVRDGLAITEFTAKHKTAIADALVPVGILDKFQALGVFANRWDHEYTVREYTDVVAASDGSEKKVDVKETITVKNAFKTMLR